MATKGKTPKVQELESDWRGSSIMALPTLSPRLTNSPITTGQTLAQPVVPVGRKLDLEIISRPEVSNKIAMLKRGALSGWGEPYNMSTTLTTSLIQAAIRAAERGDTWQLFTIFRDMVAGYTHLQNEFAKRKLTVVGQPHSILPRTKGNKDDEIACKVINEMTEHCDNWDDALDNLLDATLWPVAVGEKLFAPVDRSELDEYEFPIRYRLRVISPVSPTLFCYKIPYLAAGYSGVYAGGLPTLPMGSNLFASAGPELVSWNPNDWEPDLRFYEVFQNGYPNFSPADTYAPEQARHIIHRGTNLSKTIRDNFGGQLRAILFWWYFAITGRDWFGRYMQRWGHPFVVGKVDAQQKDTVDFMRNALSLAAEIGGLIIDKDAEAMLMQAASLNGAEGYKLFLDVCNDEVSKVVVGQTLSSSAKATGLGSGVARLHSDVRQDFRQSDMRKLSATLVKQLFRQYLRINGYRGHVKAIIWGGKDEQQAELLARTMKDFYTAGLEADDDGIETISERIGFTLRRAPMPMLAMGGGMGGGGRSKPGSRKGGRERPQRAQAKSFSADHLLIENGRLQEQLEEAIHESETHRKSLITLSADFNNLQTEMDKLKNNGKQNTHGLLTV